jgi:hypothetical protein
MQTALLITLAATAAGCAAMALARPAQAQDGFFWYSPPPNPSYQTPDGGYYSAADFSRAIWGIPCGVQCTQHAYAYWSTHRYNSPYNSPYDR